MAINIVAWNYGEVQYRMNNTTYYPDASWNLLTWYNNAWHADCLGFVRACLCGWNGDKTITAGGANTSYPCYNYNEPMFLANCETQSSDFLLLRNYFCCLLYKSGHVGLYVGEYQLDGYTYNVCEVTTSWGWGGRPSWVDTDGRRRAHKDAGPTDSFWEQWGLFYTDGTRYGITEYDGGATGATGFGTQLDQDEVLYYWDTIGDPSYDYLESLAYELYGMDADCFKVLAGWVYGEGYQIYDEFMGYMLACIPVNGYMGWEQQTAATLAAWIRGGDSGPYYDLSAFYARAEQCRTDNTAFGTATRKSIMLGLLNPNQRVVFCNGVPPKPPANLLIYEAVINGTEIWAFASAYGDRDYDITGSGIRGGIPTPAGHTHKNFRPWMYLRAPQLFERRTLLW